MGAPYHRNNICVIIRWKKRFPVRCARGQQNQSSNLEQSAGRGVFPDKGS